MRTILMVCTGNICRSPMAEVLLQTRLARDPDRAAWQVVSSGIHAVQGLPASEHTVTVMQERGLDLSQHRSRRVTRRQVQEADLVLGMTPHHVEALRQAFPQEADRIHLLAAMAGQSHGVEDPYGQSLAVYRSVAEELNRLLKRGYERILSLAEGN